MTRLNPKQIFPNNKKQIFSLLLKTMRSYEQSGNSPQCPPHPTPHLHNKSRRGTRSFGYYLPVANFKYRNYLGLLFFPTSNLQPLKLIQQRNLLIWFNRKNIFRIIRGKHLFNVNINSARKKTKKKI